MSLIVFGGQILRLRFAPHASGLIQEAVAFGRDYQTNAVWVVLDCPTAMAMAKPIVATRHGGSLETVRDGETGWLVEPSDPLALGETLRQVVQDREGLSETGRLGRQWVQQHFTSLRMCEKTIDLYVQLLEEKAERATGKILSLVVVLLTVKDCTGFFPFSSFIASFFCCFIAYHTNVWYAMPTLLIFSFPENPVSGGGRR